MAEKLIKFIEIAEFRKVLLAEKDKRFKLAYALGFGSGLRISEVIGYLDKIKPLTKDKINLENHSIRVYGKGGKERIVPTSKWLNKTNIQLLPLNIFRRTLQRRFTELCKKVLEKELSFHTLRHGFANHLANVKNTPLPIVQQMLGHSRLSTTGIYTKSNPLKDVGMVWENF